MNAHLATFTGRVLLATTVACTLASAPVAAADRAGTVEIHVSSQGLDLRQPADVKTLYTRIRNAAFVACTRSDRVGLEPVADQRAGEDNALSTAVRGAKMALLTQVYLAAHTPSEAAAHGIGAGAQLAAEWVTASAASLSGTGTRGGPTGCSISEIFSPVSIKAALTGDGNSMLPR